MPDGPTYSTVPGKLGQLLAKIRDTGVPPKATVRWLESLGFRSSNDPTMLRVLRQVGFIDGPGVPQAAWKAYRGANHKQVLGRAIRTGYPELFETYPDAHARPGGDLAHVFSTKTDAGRTTVERMVETFRNLVGEAEFDHRSQETESALETPPADAPIADMQRRLSVPASSLIVNINVSLALPDTSDESVFAAVFRAMRRNLFEEPSE